MSDEMSDIEAGNDVIGKPVLLDSRGQAPRRIAKGNDLVSRKDVQAFVENYAQTVMYPKVVEICEFYLRQTPELLAKMMADMCAANGLEFKPPMAETEQPTGSPLDHIAGRDESR